MGMAGRQPLLQAGVPLSPGWLPQAQPGRRGRTNTATLGLSVWLANAGWLLSRSWTEPSTMRFLPGRARQWAFAALDADVPFPVLLGQEG